MFVCCLNVRWMMYKHISSAICVVVEQQEKLKKSLKLKLEMAKFLQETIHETALETKKQEGNAAAEFSEFVEKVSPVQETAFLSHEKCCCQ